MLLNFFGYDQSNVKRCEFPNFPDIRGPFLQNIHYLYPRYQMTSVLKLKFLFTCWTNYVTVTILPAHARHIAEVDHFSFFRMDQIQMSRAWL